MKEIIKEIIEFDLDEGRMDYLDDMIDVFSKDGCEMVDILFDRFLKKYYADIDVSNERMTINLTDEEGHVLYGLLLDRMELSYRNGGVDDQNRVFIIFTVEEVMETLRCRSEKAVRLFAELDSKKGIGLIERKRQGLGKPAIIYVKNFAGDIS